uniref:Uncharacterized protein n=1 Tax=Lotharella oceanica TaxID=641309 RepID=A0A7S2X9X5_9EUKA|mmetsp:Transcript_21536/g.40353  ORF Transcript_21536/g.40353 Transcript_21536/m.40353 type:complete len:164 (+) Transcript_21536:349-840(+)
MEKKEDRFASPKDDRFATQTADNFATPSVAGTSDVGIPRASHVGPSRSSEVVGGASRKSLGGMSVISEMELAVAIPVRAQVGPIAKSSAAAPGVAKDSDGDGRADQSPDASKAIETQPWRVSEYVSSAVLINCAQGCIRTAWCRNVIVYCDAHRRHKRQCKAS